jgi:AcrR family transcriptional regulator
MPKVSDAYKQNKRNIILRSAEECFGKQGFKETTIDDIAKHSKTSKGSIYLYFKSKEEIFLQLNEEATANYLDTAPFEKMKSATEKLEHVFGMNGAWDINDRTRNFIRLQIETWIYLSRQEKYHQIMQNRIDRFTSFLMNIIDEGIENGEFREDLNSRTVALMFFAIQDGIALDTVVNPTFDSYKEIWDLVSNVLLSYIIK